MRYMVLSDIHGGSNELEQALSFFQSRHCDALVLLGDLLNYGPRNLMPDDYAPPKVSEILNRYRHQIMAVRGNCDSEVDQAIFSFPCRASYNYIVMKNNGILRKIFITHGHLFDWDTPQQADRIGLRAGDIVLSGHTHVSGIFTAQSGVINVNPGSTTIPKGGTPRGFAILDEEELTLHRLDGEVLSVLRIFEGTQG